MTQTLSVAQALACPPSVITNQRQCLAGPYLAPLQAVRNTVELQRQRQQEHEWSRSMVRRYCYWLHASAVDACTTGYIKPWNSSRAENAETAALVLPQTPDDE